MPEILGDFRQWPSVGQHRATSQELHKLLKAKNGFFAPALRLANNAAGDIVADKALIGREVGLAKSGFALHQAAGGLGQRLGGTFPIFVFIERDHNIA